MVATPASGADETEARAPSRAVVVSALGVTQIFAWGTTYYLPAVLAPSIAAETGWRPSIVVGGLSLGLLVAGLVSPRVGRTIGRTGGRPVLAASSALIALGLMLLGMSTHWPVYLAAWLVIGAGMGGGLYDAAFATLGGYFGREARGPITVLTLWGGFASTICWPLSAALVEAIGWRGTCFAYAGLQLGLSLPLHLLLLPPKAGLGAGEPTPPPPQEEASRTSPAQQVNVRRVSAADPEPAMAEERRPFVLLALIAVVSGAVSSAVAVHLLALLQLRDLALGAAVGLGMLLGPAQVGARLIEMLFGRRYHPVWTMVAATALITAGLAWLATGLVAPALGIVLFGAGNGIYSIARGTVPLALFEPSRYATLLGRLAMPNLLAQALAPPLGAAMITQTGPTWTWVLLSGLAALNLVLSIALWAAVTDAKRAKTPAP